MSHSGKDEVAAALPMALTAPVSRRQALGAGGLGAAGLAVSLAAWPGLAQAAAPTIPGSPMPEAVKYQLSGPGNRAIAITEWRPADTLRGTILFSHGALSAPWFYDRLLSPVVASGYRVLAPLHVDSKGHPDTANYKGLASWKARIEDMRTLIASIGDVPFIGMGHSYGALVASVLGGVEAVPPEGLSAPLVPRLAKAVVAFSPPPPMPVLVTETGYAALSVPALIETGTIDIPPGTPPTAPEPWRGHLAPFYASPPGRDHYGMLIEGANHYFGGAICDYNQPGPMQLTQLAEANRRLALFLAAYGAHREFSAKALNACLTDALPVRLMRR